MPKTWWVPKVVQQYPKVSSDGNLAWPMKAEAWALPSSFPEHKQGSWHRGKLLAKDTATLGVLGMLAPVTVLSSSVSFSPVPSLSLFYEVESLDPAQLMILLPQSPDC